jgi:predicted RNase H-like HicB family nuclease
MKSLRKKIEAIVEKTDTGYSAYNQEMGVFTTGQAIHELQTNLVDALNLALNDMGYFVTIENIQLNLDLKQFFQYYRVLNATFLAKRIGMNPTLLSQYVRGKKQPSSKQIEKIIKGIQSIGKELSEISLV